MNRHLFIFGLGFSARVIARAAQDRGWRVSGTTRSGQGDGLDGITIHAFDRDHPLPAQALDGVTHVLSSVPPDHDGDPVLDMAGVALRQLAPAWVGYLSTTGVYGDCQGDWVDEDAPLRPDLDRSRRRVLAEQAWQGSGLPVQVFRLAGIYGPGRSAIDTVRQGRARRIIKPDQVFSRIHVDDIAQVVLASIERPHPGRVYNLCDDDCAPPQDVITHACALLGVEPPPEVEWEQAQASLSPMALSFYADNKRVRNDRIKQELGVRLRYPSYRQGLAAILSA
ncbi:putative epimerase, with NAD(P)-binding Rossmann-fold domain [Magnetospirillum gryphiswaldense MSR-1 v2]|uniref:Epimerase, with NAD(P)-binding Rossmann-fold domain n=1 Tax=Magnetospirillum gryphiswaldense (strain DSM 6361 / JCM 21280 / NBRC 15271 / MSR-1) TaxID=431944 RepID=V6F6M2_MAGGM|nr:SDR family oxidoreductase [Magnetospirillum gryphiswaldense]CDL00138.1 putative epimerase, with NAD(P)-binding Rossmann-fold domain [Magnetospirillum gryphiswaldense MSR-1 v2]